MDNASRPEPDPAHQDGKMREDVDVPRASDEEVLEETARLTREGQRQRESGSQGSGSSGQ